jgi:hypothetical protein
LKVATPKTPRAKTPQIRIWKVKFYCIFIQSSNKMLCMLVYYRGHFYLLGIIEKGLVYYKMKT